MSMNEEPNSFKFDDENEDIPNADTIAAMKEADEMDKHPEQYKRYSSFDEILKEIENEML